MKRRLSVLLLPLLVHLLVISLQAQPNPSGTARPDDSSTPIPAAAPHIRSRPAGSPPVWTPLNGPAGGNVGALARDSAGNLYAAFVAGPARDRSSMGRGLYRSTDNGGTWKHAAFRGDVVRAILVEPAGTIRAVINNMSVVVSPDSIGTSTDNGVTWALQPIDFLYDISQIAARDGHIYAIRSGGYASPDFLKGWKSFAAPGTMIRRFAVGLNGSIAGTQFNSGDRMLISQDFGATWDEGKLRDIDWIDAGGDGTLYALGEHGFFISRDGAETWKSQGAPHAPFDEFSVDPHAGLFGFGDNGSLYRSIDSGHTWSASRVADIAVSGAVMAADGSIIVGTNGRGLFRGDGNTWSAVGPGIINSEIWSLGVSASGALIAGGQAAIYRSTDRGGTWNVSTAAIPVDTLFGTRIDPGINGLLVDRGNEMLAACDAWILRSFDGGASWSQFPGGGKFSNMGELIRSDRGTPFTWNEADGIIAIDGDGPAIRAAGTNGTRVRVIGGSSHSASLDPEGARNFNPDEVKIIPIRRLTANDRGVYALDTSGNIFHTSDDGGSWNRVAPPESDITARAIVATPGGPLIMVAGCGQIYRAPDGVHWQKLGNIPAGQTRLFAFANGPLLALVNGRIYRSPDGGKQWFDFDDGIDGEEITDIAIGADGDLYASSDGSGVFHCAAIETTSPPTGADAIGWSALDVRVEPESGRFIVMYNLPSRTQSHVALYDESGVREIATINDLALPGGSSRHVIPFGKLPAGTYLVRLTVGCGAPVEKTFAIPGR